MFDANCPVIGKTTQPSKFGKLKVKPNAFADSLIVSVPNSIGIFARWECCSLI